MSEPRYLLVRFSAIGDCVMAAWAATAIRRKHPDAFLVWAAESRCAPVIDRKALCSRVCEFPRDRWKRRRWSPGVWREQIAAYARLRRFRFDYGIDLQGHSKTALCLRIANPDRRVQARATDSMAKRLNFIPGEPTAGMHTVEWNHQVLCTLGEFELPEQPIMPVERELPDGLVTISVSAGQREKAYPAEQWATVAEALLAQGRRVAFLGGPTDEPLAVPGAEDFVRKLPLEETMRMVARSALHLCGDTGTGHMAAALGVPVVSVFGPTDERIYRPYTTRGLVLKNGSSTAATSPAEVVEAAGRMLG